MPSISLIISQLLETISDQILIPECKSVGIDVTMTENFNLDSLFTEPFSPYNIDMVITEYTFIMSHSFPKLFLYINGRPFSIKEKNKAVCVITTSIITNHQPVTSGRPQSFYFSSICINLFFLAS